MDGAKSGRCGQSLVPRSHQTKSAVYVGELVSHNDFDGGPSSSNLYDGLGDGHNVHSDVHIWMCIGCVGPITRNLWYVHMAQLCRPKLFLVVREVRNSSS